MTRRAVFNDGGTFDDGSPITSFPGVGAVSSVFGRTGAVVAVAGDYAGVLNSFLTGATQASRYVGATASGAPVSGTFAVGDFVIAQNGHIFVCTVAGSPGTWVDVAAAASGVTSINKTGSTALTGAVTLTGGTNVTITQSGNDLSIAASGGGSGPVVYFNKPAGNITRAATSVGAFSTPWQITGVVVASGQNVKLTAQMMLGTPTNKDAIICIKRGSTQIATFVFVASGTTVGINWSESLIWIDENPGAGTYTYEVQAAQFVSGTLTVYAASNPTTDTFGGTSIFIAEVYTP